MSERRAASIQWSSEQEARAFVVIEGNASARQFWVKRPLWRWYRAAPRDDLIASGCVSLIGIDAG